MDSRSSYDQLRGILSKARTRTRPLGQHTKAATRTSETYDSRQVSKEVRRFRCPDRCGERKLQRLQRLVNEVIDNVMGTVID